VNGSGVIFDEFQDAQPNTRSLISDGGTILAAVLVFVGYYVGAKIGFALTFKPVPVSVLWPPNSILLAALLLRPRRTWWDLVTGRISSALARQLQSNVPPRMIFAGSLAIRLKR
jgi:integral membrane sensor domain MASE1